MGKIKLMIVDDNRGFLEALAEHFRTLNDIEVVAEATDGAEALGLIETTGPDVVLMDMIMPKLDGIGVLEYVATNPNFKNSARPRFIMFSSFVPEIIVQKAMFLGASYYMLKPFDLVTLTQRIRTVAHEGKFYVLQEDFGEAESFATGTLGVGYPYPSSMPTVEVREQSGGGKNLEIDITKLMLDIGVPAHIKGYQYLRDSIMLAVEDAQVINAMTKVLYPCIAKKYETTPSRVERAIRHAIEVAWNRGKVDIFHQVFGYSISTGRGKPTNGEFIAMLADRVRLKMR